MNWLRKYRTELSPPFVKKGTYSLIAETVTRSRIRAGPKSTKFDRRVEKEGKRFAYSKCALLKTFLNLSGFSLPDDATFFDFRVSESTGQYPEKDFDSATRETESNQRCGVSSQQLGDFG
jgi:hypothetical protein